MSADSEPVEVTDSGFHLPGHHSQNETGLPGDAVNSTTLLSSLLSLPPRAQKRRRGSRFKHDEEETPASDAAMPVDEEHKQLEQRPLRERKFEYLDHTADIQLHSWGDTLAEALEQNVLAMFSYITDLAKVDVDPTRTDTFEVKGHDLDSLLFTLLDEFLYRFATNEWIPRDVRIDSLDLNNFTIRVTGFGEHFTLSKHPQGTEIKAITYSNMQIYIDGKRVKSDNDENRKRAKPDDNTSSSNDAMITSEDGQTADDDVDEEESSHRGSHGADIYVIVDI